MCQSFEVQRHAVPVRDYIDEGFDAKFTVMLAI
jgi:hypothetical protein